MNSIDNNSQTIHNNIAKHTETNTINTIHNKPSGKCFIIKKIANYLIRIVLSLIFIPLHMTMAAFAGFIVMTKIAITSFISQDMNGLNSFSSIISIPFIICFGLTCGVLGAVAALMLDIPTTLGTIFFHDKGSIKANCFTVLEGSSSNYSRHTTKHIVDNNVATTTSTNPFYANYVAPNNTPSLSKTKPTTQSII